ncbi:MAG: FAD-dependent thymidylate synthase [Actinomycetota bacterium]
MTLPWFVEEPFTEEEQDLLRPYFTNLDSPVFALVNLPEATKGALFARYSRSPKSLRRLFLDEFAEHAERPLGEGDVGARRAEELYQRVFLEYGDDSVAQLGGVHLACEQSSQLLAKVLEWGRLMAYLEQSTRYVPYDDKPGGRWRYAIPPEVEAAGLTDGYTRVLDLAFETYAKWLEPMQEMLRATYPQQEGDSDFVYRSTIRAKACDALRGLLPAATRTNVGIYGTGQAYEQLLLRMRAHPLDEVRGYADMMLIELRKVIPAFLTRVDVEDRGGAWSRYLKRTREQMVKLRTSPSMVQELLDGVPSRPEVVLSDSDPEGEVKVVAAALYSIGDIPDDRLIEIAGGMSAEERARILNAYVGERTNRRHKPGRAFERTSYRFDVLCDYGAFRDLQRHRMLTIEWQRLSPIHGFELPPEVEQAGATEDWKRVMEESAALYEELVMRGLDEVGQYAVAMAYRIRFVMQMNAREAMHVIELRTTPQGHPVYRRVSQEMHRLIAEGAGHSAIAEAMRFADHSSVELERLDAERRTEAKRKAADHA